MKKLGILAVIVVILLVFGAGSARLLPGLPVLVQTADPNASVMAATSEQANQLFFFVIFVLINLIGAGVTIALLMWFLGRATSYARTTENKPMPVLNRPLFNRRQSHDLPAGDTPAQLSDSTS